MINFSRRSEKKELLDRDDIPFEDIRKNMQELNFINSHLGGHKITLAGMKQLLGNKKKVSICEIGCGGGDNLTALATWCLHKNTGADFTGIDINPHCIEFAKSRSPQSGAKFIVSDYKKVSFDDQKPAIIFSSLFCHHFPDEELIDMFRWMKENSTSGFFINDLQRHPLAFNLIRILTKMFSHSYLVKNDAPLSVLRGFKKNELEQLIKAAGINNYTISWKWAFRYLVVVHNEV